jgi:hypothetical protein
MFVLEHHPILQTDRALKRKAVRTNQVNCLEMHMDSTNQPTRVGVVQECFPIRLNTGAIFRPRYTHQVRYEIFLAETGETIVVREAMDATASLICEGDTVKVYLDDFRNEATVRPLTQWRVHNDSFVSDLPEGTVVREKEFLDRFGMRRKTSLLKLNESGEEVVVMEPANFKDISRMQRSDNKIRGLLAKSPKCLVGTTTVYEHFVRQYIASPKVGRRVKRIAYGIRVKDVTGYEVANIDQPYTLTDTKVQQGDLVNIMVAADFGPILDSTVQPVTTLGGTVRNWLNRKLRRYIHT